MVICVLYIVYIVKLGVSFNQYVCRFGYSFGLESYRGKSSRMPLAVYFAGSDERIMGVELKSGATG